MKSGIVKISRFSEGLTVFKPGYYLNPGKRIISDLIEKNISYKLLSEISDKLYQGGIFKRVYVKKNSKSF